MFNAVNLEKISIPIRKLLGISVTTNNSKTLTHEEKNFFLDKSNRSLTNIEKQLIVSLPDGLSEAGKLEFVRNLSEERADDSIPVSEPSEAQNSLLPASTVETGSQTATLLANRLEDYKKDNSLLLDRGALMLIHRDREKLSFSKEELLFLTQSSLRNDFPYWYWAFYYRENYENITPLLKEVFNHPNLKIRKGAISALDNFTNTSEDIFRLSQSETSPIVVGHMASIFVSKDLDYMQRIIGNALTRKIVPVFPNKIVDKFDTKTQIDLGRAEKRFLHEIIENGWLEEKKQALTILSISVDDGDLPILEKMLGEITFADANDLILTCISKIGKTTKTAEIKQDLMETQRLGTFLASLDTLVSVGCRDIFPELLSWLKNSNLVKNRFWGEVNDRKIDNAIQNAVSSMLDSNTYEDLVQFILDNYSPTEYGNIMSWRFFWTLKENKEKPFISELIRKEKRLQEFKKWQDVSVEIEIESLEVEKNTRNILNLITKDDYEKSLKTLRKICETQSPEWVFVNVRQKLEDMRADLSKRLSTCVTNNHSEEVKEITGHDLEHFLGKNDWLYRLARERKKGSRYEVEGEEDKVFDELYKDIQHFDSIEETFLKHVLKSSNQEIKKFHGDIIGRPYECIYVLLGDKNNFDKGLQQKLFAIADSNPNPLLKLDAINAIKRMGLCDNDSLRLKILSLLLDSREKSKDTRGRKRDNNTWLIHELTYGWATKSLSEFGNIEDFPLIQEEANREKVLSRHFHKYSNYFDNLVFDNLLELTETLDDLEEKENALDTLDDLDYKWTKKILSIDE